jgi:hypothetical protein
VPLERFELSWSRRCLTKREIRELFLSGRQRTCLPCWTATLHDGCTVLSLLSAQRVDIAMARCGLHCPKDSMHFLNSHNTMRSDLFAPSNATYMLWWRVCMKRKPFHFKLQASPNSNPPLINSGSRLLIPFNPLLFRQAIGSALT